MRRSILPTALVMGLALLLTTTASALAAPASDTRPPASLSAGTYPGNYCAGCHTGADTRPAAVTDWSGGIDRETISRCNAATRVREEVYYTERMLLAVDRGRTGLARERCARHQDRRG